MDLIKLGAELARIGAPILGGALGGPVGAALASTVVGALADALGVAPTPEAVGGALQSQPNAAEIVKQVEEEQAPAVVSEMNAILADAQDARATTVKLVEAGSTIAWGAPVVSVIVMVGFALLSYLAIYAPPGQREVLLFLLGTWSSLATAVVGYWLGSSRGSQDKDATIKQMSQSAAAQIGTTLGTAIRKGVRA